MNKITNVNYRAIIPTLMDTFTIVENSPHKSEIIYSLYITGFSILILVLGIYIYRISTNKAETDYKLKTGNTLKYDGKYKIEQDMIIQDIDSVIVISGALLISLFTLSKGWFVGSIYIKLILIAMLMVYFVSSVLILLSILLAAILSRTGYNTTNIILTILFLIYSGRILGSSLQFLDLPRSII
jgi:uncharacterized membrane protein